MRYPSALTYVFERLGTVLGRWRSRPTPRPLCPRFIPRKLRKRCPSIIDGLLLPWLQGRSASGLHVAVGLRLVGIGRLGCLGLLRTLSLGLGGSLEFLGVFGLVDSLGLLGLFGWHDRIRVCVGFGLHDGISERDASSTTCVCLFYIRDL